MAHKADFQELFKELVEVLSDLGWTIAVPITEDESMPGMVIGDKEYVKLILSKLPNKWPYEVFRKG